MSVTRADDRGRGVRRRPKSRALYERGRGHAQRGPHDGRVFPPFPFYVEGADRARKWDMDGHEYIDCSRARSRSPAGWNRCGER